MTRLVFHPPADNERGPKHLESLIAGWSFMADTDEFSLGVSCLKGQIMFLLDVPKNRQRIVSAQLANAFPGSRIEVVSETNLPQSSVQHCCSFRLSPDVIPIRLHDEFIEEHSRQAIDPLEVLLESIKAGRSGSVGTEVWLRLTPARVKDVDTAAHYAPFVFGKCRFSALRQIFRRCCSGRKWYERVSRSCLSAMVMTSGVVDAAVDQKLKQQLLNVQMSATISSDKTNLLSKEHLERIQAGLKPFTGSHAEFYMEKTPQAGFLLTPTELASLWHPPVRSVHVPRLSQAHFRELEPPHQLTTSSGDPGSVTLGRTAFRNESQRVRMDLDARRRHFYVIGKTGMGKTTLLRNVITEDIQSGRGTAVIDPHGDLCVDVMNAIPRNRTNDVIVFDPADRQYAIAYNPLHVPNGGDSTLVADGILSAFQKVFGLDESQAPRMLHILRNCLLSLVEMPQASLLNVQQLLTNSLYRNSVVARVSNPVVRSFWIDEFGKWKPHDRAAFTASLQNKLGAFLTNEKLQRILGQSKGKLDLRSVMDEGKILIVNLSKGRVGENASNLLGTLLVTSLQLAAMSRADVSESDRCDFSICIDEFQNYATQSIATFLSEARKFRTHLILSHQYTAQLPEEILSAVLGNVGSMLAFQVGADDAELFERQFGGNVTAENLTNIPKYHAYCRLLIDGMPSRPFSIRTIPPDKHRPNRAEQVRTMSRRQYCTAT